ncbi:adhesion G protein-coupled receptor E5-like [Agelaius tricolor]|uniref:adhesion G protein-coupled receptor E5-like n=1 Tax=Agelaius tricolor TaxID=9191 RepID=UPI0039F1D1B7
MALQGAHLYVLLVQVFAPAWLRPRPLLALGYGPALAIVGLSAAAFPKGYGTDQYCWLSLERGFRWSFRGPVIVITAANAVILVVTLWKLVQKFHEVTPDMGTLRRARVLWVTSLGQLSLLGSGWALGVGAGLGWAGGAGPPLPPGSAPPAPPPPVLRRQRRPGAADLPVPLPGAPQGAGLVPVPAVPPLAAVLGVHQ